MYNTKFVQTLAFAYRNCPLSLEVCGIFILYIQLYFTSVYGSTTCMKKFCKQKLNKRNNIWTANAECSLQRDRATPTQQYQTANGRRLAGSELPVWNETTTKLKENEREIVSVADRVRRAGREFGGHEMRRDILTGNQYVVDITLLV